MSNFESTGGTTMDATFDHPATERFTTGRHPVNTGHLVMGLVFVGLVGIWALIAGDVVADDDIRWLLPIPWVGGGLIGLAVVTWTNVRSRRTASPDNHATYGPSTGNPTESTWSSQDDDTEPTEEIR